MDSESRQAFINNPDTVDFVTRYNDKFLRAVENDPRVLIGSVLSERYVIGYVNKNNLDIIQNLLGSAFISAQPFILGLLDRASLESAGIIQVQEQSYLRLRGQGVLIGFVDTGIDYTKSTFINDDGTSRIQYLYDMSDTREPPDYLLIGRDYNREQISAALASDNPYDIVPVTDDVGHGTFLASVAAGRAVGDFIGAAPESELIVVKLRTARQYYREKFLVPPNQPNAYETTVLMGGIEYIVRRAHELNRPVVICIALGTNQGGHDGFSLPGEYLTNISNEIGVCLCTAAGNESQARRHTQGVLMRTGDSQNIFLRVVENAGDIFISIVNTVSDRISVSIKSPTGEVVGRVPAKSGTIFSSSLILERSTVIVEYYFPMEGSSGQTTIVKLLNATPGIWSITVYGDIVLDGTYHAWLPIEGFVAPGVEFLTPSPNYTIVFPGTIVGSITCGAYDASNNSLYIQSSWGPTRLPMISPDLTAPGVNVGGVFPDGYGMMCGTSVAAAITAGASAILMQWGVVEGNDPAMGTYQVRGYLIRGCSRDPNVVYPNTQSGYGRLNLIQTFNQMRDV